MEGYGLIPYLTAEAEERLFERVRSESDLRYAARTKPKRDMFFDGLVAVDDVAELRWVRENISRGVIPLAIDWEEIVGPENVPWQAPKRRTPKAIEVFTLFSTVLRPPDHLPESVVGVAPVRLAGGHRWLVELAGDDEAVVYQDLLRLPAAAWDNALWVKADVYHPAAPTAVLDDTRVLQPA